MKRISIVLVIIVLLSLYTITYSIEEKNFVDFPEADYEKGERFIYGSILKVDYENRKLIINQHMDHHSQRVSSILKVREDVVIILKRNNKAMNIDFSDLKAEDMFGLILDQSNMVRGIIIFV